MNLVSTFRVAPGQFHFVDVLPGPDFTHLTEAVEVAMALDETRPLDGGDEWCVYERQPDGTWENFTA